MENEREVRKLVSVLRAIARGARHEEWAGREADAARFAAAQYNRVLARLGEIDAGAAQIFAPLGDGATPRVIGFAARELAAYFDDEPREHHGHRHRGRRGEGCAPHVWIYEG